MKLALLLGLVLLAQFVPRAQSTPSFYGQPDRVARLEAENARLEKSVHYHAALARRYQRVLRHDPNVSEAINLASTTYHVPRSTMWRRALCESHAKPSAKNRSSDATGLFQIMFPSTWRTTPFAAFSPYSAYANAMAAGWMMSAPVGRGDEWACR